MTKLVACLTTGKGGWASVSSVMKFRDWESIFLITNSFGKEKFTSDKKFEFVLVDDKSSAAEMRDAIIKQLSGKFSIEEVALNLTSGTGKEHMAIISALLRLGAGIRLLDENFGKVSEL